jgi:hypothetical protein
MLQQEVGDTWKHLEQEDTKKILVAAVVDKK